MQANRVNSGTGRSNNQPAAALRPTGGHRTTGDVVILLVPRVDHVLHISVEARGPAEVRRVDRAEGDQDVPHAARDRVAAVQQGGGVRHDVALGRAQRRGVGGLAGTAVIVRVGAAICCAAIVAAFVELAKVGAAALVLVEVVEGHVEREDRACRREIEGDTAELP